MLHSRTVVELSWLGNAVSIAITGACFCVCCKYPSWPISMQRAEDELTLFFHVVFFNGSRDLIEDGHQRELRAPPTEPQRDVQAPQWALPFEKRRRYWPLIGHM
jgi:hypothetical protein